MFLLYGLALYVAIGLITAFAFVTVGVTQVAHFSMTAGARILILPGCVAFWPYVLARWLKSRRVQ